MSGASFRTKGLVIFLILFFPSAAYLLFSTGKNHFKHLEILGPKELAPNGDTIYHTVPDFHFIDQAGQAVSQKDFEGKVYVADFFFATCPTICPKMTLQLSRVQEKFLAQRDVRIISHTVDPKKDSVQALAAYGKKFMVNPSKWRLVTGDKKEIYKLAREGYFIGVDENKVGDGGETDFIHDDVLVLVDKEKRIRGIYKGTDPNEVDRLLDEISVLLYEYKERENSH